MRITEQKKDLLDGIEGIIFDLDDTLYLQKDFKISGFHAVARWMEKNGYAAKPVVMAALHTILEQHGPSYPYMFNRLVERLALADTLAPQLVQVLVQHPPDINLFPRVREMLSCLRKRYKLGILTDGRLQVQKAKVQALGLEPLVEAILYSESLGLSKPAEQLFTWFEDHFHLPAQALVYIADNPSKDFIGANRRGWRTIRVLTGEHANQRAHSALKASAVIANVRDCATPETGS